MSCTTSSSAGFQDSLISLQVLFKGLDGCASDVENPRVRIFHGFEQRPVDVDVLESANPSVEHTYPLLPVDPPLTGQYRFSFLIGLLEPGLYNLEFAGEIDEVLTGGTRKKTIVIKGDIEIGEISRRIELINRMQMGLMDDFPDEYRLDEPVYQWKRDQLFVYMKEALSRFNATGPRITNFTLDSLPVNTDELVVTGGKIWAIYARSRLEKANEMSYSDVHSLDIKRADFYKGLADTLLQDWIRAVQDWKKATPPTPIGLRTQRLPFRIARVIGLLPNYQSFFSG